MINLGSILPVGTIIHSMLTTTQFQSEYGENWVLVDGRSVTGSKYEQVTGSSAIPDMRGAFLRAKGSTYNPDGDLALGTYTADKIVSHSHTYPIVEPSTGGGVEGVATNRQQVGATTESSSSVGGNETAPRSITVNIFIRIN